MIPVLRGMTQLRKLGPRDNVQSNDQELLHHQHQQVLRDLALQPERAALEFSLTVVKMCKGGAMRDQSMLHHRQVLQYQAQQPERVAPTKELLLSSRHWTPTSS